MKQQKLIGCSGGNVESGSVDEFGILTLLLTDGSEVLIDLSTLLDDNDTVSILTSLNTGNEIASHNDGNGNITPINETITSLSILGDTLTYSDEQGNNTNIDLSLYLDDTNLAYLINGTVDVNGIATFNRDDATSFTVDFSNLLNTNDIDYISNVQLTGNNLVFTGQGNAFSSSVDLSSFLDNVNLSRLVSGSVNGAGLLTMVRDDATNFSIDLSSLLDNTDTLSSLSSVNSGKVIASHNDGNGNNTDIEETVTNLSISSNILTYVNENGISQNIDLSLYLDDTNLSRLVSGTLDNNGLATFVRDDATEFTVDFSNLVLTWEYFVLNWSTNPTFNTNITGGRVFDYTLNGVTRYRFIPIPYNATGDAFYSSFDGTNLTGLIITRG